MTFRDMLEIIGVGIVSITKTRFDKEQAPSGLKWHKLSKYTLAHRRKKGKDAKILQDTGQLKQSVFNRVEGDTVKIGVSKDYGKDHQYGIPHKRLPARPILDLEEIDKTEQDFITDTCNSFLDSIVKELDDKGFE